MAKADYFTHWKDAKRIAELEAELADGYACHVAAHQLLEERAEKAEAEVERLRAENRAMWEALGRPLSVQEAPE